MEFKAGDEVWYIKVYVPKWNRPFYTHKICKGVLKSVTPNVKYLASDRKTILFIETHYIIKGQPNAIYTRAFATKEEAKLYFKQKNFKEYYK